MNLLRGHGYPPFFFCKRFRFFKRLQCNKINMWTKIAIPFYIPPPHRIVAHEPIQIPPAVHLRRSGSGPVLFPRRRCFSPPRRKTQPSVFSLGQPIIPFPCRASNAIYRGTRGKSRRRNEMDYRFRLNARARIALYCLLLSIGLSLRIIVFIIGVTRCHLHLIRIPIKKLLHHFQVIHYL